MATDNSNEVDLIEIPKDEMEIDPLKLYVGNLKRNDNDDDYQEYGEYITQDELIENVNKNELLKLLIPHVNITKVFVSHKTSQDPQYGFLYLATEEDVKKFLDLNNQDFHLFGTKLVFRPALSRYLSPGEENYVRQPLPDRNYNLSPVVSNRSSIHILIDDVMIKIFGYLPLKTRILCEIVCRRWQAILYLMFKSTTHLNLDILYCVKNSISAVTEDKLSKLLLLTGDNLKSLSLSVVSGFFFTDYQPVTNVNLFLTIAQLCTNLETLELANFPISFFDDIKALSDCNNLKFFSAKKCFELDEYLFKKLMCVLPYLEKINVSFSKITGRSFNNLPEGLKELNISFCRGVTKKSLHRLNKNCTNLEVLEMENLEANKEFLEQLGVNCKNIRCLKFHSLTTEVSNQIKVFTKLTNLRIVASAFELSNIENVKDLEELCIKVKQKSINRVNFGMFKCLKTLVVTSSPFCKQELMSLEKCKNLQYVTIKDCVGADQEIIKKIVKGCPEIKNIKCPNVWIDDHDQFLNETSEIVSNRLEVLEPIKILVNQSGLNFDEMDDLNCYNNDKIILDFEYESEDDEGDFEDNGDLYGNAEDISDPCDRLDYIIEKESNLYSFANCIRDIYKE